jgi:hypothetical protein
LQAVAGEPTWIERLGISGWVVRDGWLDQPSLGAVYQSAEALLALSRYEPFGLPLVEAMASGTPALTSGRYGSREIVRDAAVLVEPEDLDSIEQGIRSMSATLPCGRPPASGGVHVGAVRASDAGHTGAGHGQLIAVAISRARARDSKGEDRMHSSANLFSLAKDSAYEGERSNTSSGRCERPRLHETL